MATKAGVGMSRNHNPSVAGREAAEQALQKAGVAKPDFVFTFGSIGYDQRSLVRAVRETTRGAPLTGCSAEGTINGDDADESNFSVVVTAISSDELEEGSAQWTAKSSTCLHTVSVIRRAGSVLVGWSPARLPRPQDDLASTLKSARGALSQSALEEEHVVG